MKLALATVFTVAVLLIACSSEKSSPLQGAGTSTDAKPLSAATATHLPTMTLAQSASPDTVEPTPTLQEPTTTTPPTEVVAQNGPSFSDALEPKEGDEEVVATVQGHRRYPWGHPAVGRILDDGRTMPCLVTMPRTSP